MDRVAHFEIAVDNKDKAKEFYGSVFGWQIMDVPMQAEGGTTSYTTATTIATDPQTQMPIEPGGINGAIVERTAAITGPVVTIYVESIYDCLEKVTAAGGTIVAGRQEVPGMGAYAYVTDVSGNVVGLWESA
jgi:predicted enzyme related to lactoylglutathione lyase